jgi:hypothetical protein
MPWGMPKKYGGESQAAHAFMERCIASVEKSGKPKLNAILICKSQWAKMNAKKGK